MIVNIQYTNSNAQLVVILVMILYVILITKEWLIHYKHLFIRGKRDDKARRKSYLQGHISPWTVKWVGLDNYFVITRNNIELRVHKTEIEQIR